MTSVYGRAASHCLLRSWFVALGSASLLALPACASENTGTLDLFPPSAQRTGVRPSGQTGPTADARTAPSSGGIAPPGPAEADARPVATSVPTPAPPVCHDGGCVVAVGCRTDGDCQSGSAARCETGAGVCVECLSATDCTSGDRPLCDGSNHRCVECTTDADCHDPSKPGCFGPTGRCEECSKDSQCQLGQTCDLTQGQCR